MQSIDVITGGTATASQYNLLRADVITNVTAAYNATAAASAAATAAAAVAADLVTHKATAASVHGLPTGVSVLGSKQAGGLRIEYATGAATWTHTGGQTESHHVGVSWANPFNNIYAVTESFEVGSTSGAAVLAENRGCTYSTTAATRRFRISDASTETASVGVRFIAIGN